MSSQSVRVVFSLVFAAVVSVLLSNAASADKPRIYQNAKGVAASGYDVVAYFVDQKPVPGSAKHAVKHGGATWWFTSAAHAAQFREQPAAYLPQYGGWCAYAMSTGKKVPTDPKAWALRGGKLYLNYTPAIRKRWNKRPDAYIKNADAAWARQIAPAKASPTH